MASIKEVTFNLNTVTLGLDQTVKSLDLPGVTASGVPGPWSNNEQIIGVLGTAKTAVIYWESGAEPTTYDAIQAPPGPFAQAATLTASGESISLYAWTPKEPD